MEKVKINSREVKIRALSITNFILDGVSEWLPEKMRANFARYRQKENDRIDCYVEKTLLEQAQNLPLAAPVHPIPPMTHEMGKCWDQPDRFALLVDDTAALMSGENFKKLSEYSCSVPSGVYAGKMWRAKVGGKWYLRWYQDSQKKGYCDILTREIILCD